jgi:hypothetical protein
MGVIHCTKNNDNAVTQYRYRTFSLYSFPVSWQISGPGHVAALQKVNFWLRTDVHASTVKKKQWPRDKNIKKFIVYISAAML